VYFFVNCKKNFFIKVHIILIINFCYYNLDTLSKANCSASLFKIDGIDDTTKKKGGA